MTLPLHISPRAARDAQQIFDWIAQRSPDGADRWYLALERALRQVVRNPQAYGLAPENEQVDYELRQFLFKTRHGRTYRGLFSVVGNEIHVLRIRGPGQAALDADELEE